jgi:hypothetical protein
VDLSRAAALLEESLTLARAGGDTWLVAVGLMVWGIVAEFQGDYAREQQFTQEALALFRQFKDVWGIAWALHRRGQVSHGGPATAQESHRLGARGVARRGAQCACS